MSNEIEIPQRDRYLTRQMDLIPMAVLDTPIKMIGAGGIGSVSALALAKMGFNNLEVWDFDVVSEENINSQFFKISDIGRPKVEALRDIIKEFTGTEITAKNEKYESGHLNGILIMAVDSMKARKMIWEAHKETAIGTKLCIDGRMGAESAMVFAMKPMNATDVVSYDKTLYSDENAVQELCTAKSTAYTTFAISAHIAKVVKDFLCREDHSYTRNMSWDISKNAQQCFQSK